MLRPGKAEGPLLGGNLSLISHLVGSPFMPDLRGGILFIEERGESLYRVDRMLTHLRLSGVLSHLAALLVGHFEDCGDVSSVDELLVDVTSDFDIPLVSGLPAGHGPDNITLPIGLRVSLDTGDMSLRTREPCVSS
jgi:muramoyltetrapeptide carboxypeptidase